VFGFFFIVRPFSFILDSFHIKIRQKIVFVYQIFKQNGAFVIRYFIHSFRYSSSLSNYGSNRRARVTSLHIRFQSEFLSFYRYILFRKVAMCPIRYFGRKFSKPSLSRYSRYRKARFASRPFGPARRARY
jgi:hypothetical protein